MSKLKTRKRKLKKLWKFIVGQWNWIIAHLLKYFTVRQVALLDSALCNRQLRPHWLQTLSTINISGGATWTTKVTPAFIKWIELKCLRFEGFAIHYYSRPDLADAISLLLNYLGTNCPQLQYFIIDNIEIETLRVNHCDINNFVSGCRNLIECRISLTKNDWLKLLEVFGTQRSLIKRVYIRNYFSEIVPNEEETSKILGLFSQGCPQLEVFALEHEEDFLPADGISHLVTNCPFLTELELHISDESAVEIGKSKCLKILDSSYISEVGLKAIVTASAGKLLESICCVFKTEEDIWDIYRPIADNCPNISVLRISGTLAAELPWQDAAYLMKKCQKLKEYSGPWEDEFSECTFYNSQQGPLLIGPYIWIYV